MHHRHITDTGYTLQAIDGIIDRGKRSDWGTLQIAARSDLDIARMVLHVAEHNLDHPYTIRYHYWHHFANMLLREGDANA